MFPQLNDKDIAMCFKRIEEVAKIVHKLREKGGDKYYTAETKFKMMLVEFLRFDFVDALNKRQILLLLQWVIRFRPIALHSIGYDFSKRNRAPEDCSTDEGRKVLHKILDEVIAFKATNWK